MITKFMQASYSDVGSIAADGTYNLYNFFNNSRILLSFDCAVSGVPPIITRTYTEGSRTYSEALKLYGRSSGKMVAMLSTALNDDDLSVLTFSEAVDNLRVHYKQEASFISIGPAVGPVSISTMCQNADSPFVCVVLCKPLFLDAVPSLRFYTGPTGNVSGITALIAGLIGDFEYEAVETIINHEIRCNISYAYSTDADIGKVVSATLRSDVTDTMPKYSIVADLVVGIPSAGIQDSVIVGSENPANYLKRKYVPRYGTYDELGYVPMEPIVLECTDDGEVQASGRLIYEHSKLLTGEPDVSKYVVTLFCIKGAGNVSVYDNKQEFAELSEYEY